VSKILSYRFIVIDKLAKFFRGYFIWRTGRTIPPIRWYWLYIPSFRKIPHRDGRTDGQKW